MKKTSLGMRLLRIVFGLYFIITLSVTAVQMTLEYNHTKKTMFTTIKQLRDTFESSFSTALWEYNEPQIKASLDGISQIDIVSGLFVANEHGYEVTRVGYKPEFKEKISEIPRIDTKYDQISRLDLADKSFFSRVYEFSFHVYYITDKGKKEYVGKSYVFAKEESVIRIVKHGFTLILVNSVIKTIGLWIVFLICTKVLVTDPLNQLTKITNEIDPKNPRIGPQAQIYINKLLKRTDEIGMLTDKYTRLLEKISLDLNLINELNSSLERKVEERTQQLTARNRDITILLQNMPLAIMTLNKKMVIEKEYSLYTESLLQTTNIADNNLSDVVFAYTDINEDNLSRINTSLQFCFGNDDFNFEVNQHNLPNEIIFKSEFICECIWEPVYDDKKMVEKVMIILRDVTQLRKLQQSNLEQQEEINIIGEILNAGVDKTLAFSANSQNFIQEIRDAINAPNLDIQLIFRNMHTIKGNARTYNFTKIAQSSHIAEDFYSKVKTDQSLWDKKIALDNLGEVEKQIQYYLSIIDIKLNKFQSSDNNSEKLFAIIDSLSAKIESNKGQDDAAQLANAFKEIVYQKKIINHKPLSQILNDEIQSLDTLAKSLNKKTPNVVFDESAYVFAPEASNLLKDIFTHCLRNSIDHGLETTKDREILGKNTQGTIKISVHTKDSNNILVSIQDDGKGLNLGALKLKAQNFEKMSDEQIAQLIFQSGISTQTEVTDISGRGVGMDAVKSFIEKQNGHLNIKFTGDKNEQDFRPFKLEIELPSKFTASSHL